MLATEKQTNSYMKVKREKKGILCLDILLSTVWQTGQMLTFHPENPWNLSFLGWIFLQYHISSTYKTSLKYQ